MCIRDSTQATAQCLVNTEGVATPKAISQLDDKMIETLSKNCRKQTPERPAGRVLQRGRNNANAVQDLQLGIFQQRSLTLMSFFVKYKFMTSREIIIEDITPETLEEIDGFERHIATMENPSLDGVPKLTKSRKFEFFDEFTEFLNDNLGAVSLRPLGYVVRKVAAVPDSATQAPFGHADSPFGSYFKEIEARAPIVRLNQAGQAAGKDRHFTNDNMAVWKLLYATVKDTEFLTHIKKHQKKQDGRKAFLALHSSLLGKQAIDNQIGIAENRLQSLEWDGKVKKNWNFNKCVLAHKEQHVILDKLKDLSTYSRINENAKRRHFNKGITDPALETVIASISGNINPKSFDECVEHFNNFIQQKKLCGRSNAKTVNISAIAKSGNRSFDKDKKRTLNDDGFDKTKDYSKYSMPVRFFTPDEWNKLSKGQRNFIRQTRRKGKEEDKSVSNKIAALEVTIAALTAKLEDKTPKRKRLSDTSETDSDESVDKPVSKRTRVKTNKRG